MRELIIARIEELLGSLDGIKSAYRWRRFWYDKEFNLSPLYSDKPSEKELKDLTHISSIPWKIVPDEQLLEIFEEIIKQYNKQM